MVTITGAEDVRAIPLFNLRLPVKLENQHITIAQFIFVQKDSNRNEPGWQSRP
jgi:hypothetical protein